MEEIVSMVVHGCKLAKELEANLRGMAGEPKLISRSCDEIIKTFLAVKERITSTTAGHVVFNYPQMFYPPPHESATTIDPSLQEWLRSSVTQAMDLFTQTQNLAGRSQFDQMVGVGGGGGREYMEGSSSSMRLRGTGGGGDVHVQVPLMEVSVDSSAAAGRGGGGGGGGSSSTRNRRR